MKSIFDAWSRFANEVSFGHEVLLRNIVLRFASCLPWQTLHTSDSEYFRLTKSILHWKNELTSSMPEELVWDSAWCEVVILKTKTSGVRWTQKARASLRKCRNCNFRLCGKQILKLLVSNRMVVGAISG